MSVACAMPVLVNSASPNSKDTAPFSPSSQLPCTIAPLARGFNVHAPASSMPPVMTAYAAMLTTSHCSVKDVGANSVTSPTAMPTKPSRKSVSQLTANPAPMVKRPSANAKSPNRPISQASVC